MRLDVYVHQEASNDTRLEQILILLQQLQQEGTEMSAELDALTASVTASASVTDGAVVLLNGLGARIAELAAEVAAGGGDPAALNALAAELDTNAAELAAAVTANTPVEEPAPVDPPVEEEPAPVDPPVEEPV